MKLAVDVDYRENTAHIAGVAFAAWEDAEPSATYSSELSDIEAYEPGSFYKRELPCILKLLDEHVLMPECIVIDGFVYLDGCDEPGLGKHLYNALGGKVTIIGVAKRPFKSTPKSCEVYRGQSAKPLYVTSEGIPFDIAKAHVSSMYGDFRIPDILKKADQLCRQHSTDNGSIK